MVRIPAVAHSLCLLGLSAVVSCTPIQPGHHPHACGDFNSLSLTGAEILSVDGAELRNYTVPAAVGLGLPTPIYGINVCAVTVSYTHHDTNDTVSVQVWLPLHNYNGVIVSVGGSAWSTGFGDISLGPVAIDGYVAVSTDAGLDGRYDAPLWALQPDGSINEGLLLNFASRSVHDMAVLGKAIATAYYGTAPKFSYWNGCSTGGRQGMVAAQKFPGDFDGILAGAPAIYWTEYVIAELWPQVAMREAGYFASPTELAAVTELAIAACDGLDGVRDGVISEVNRCDFDPTSAVGQVVTAQGEQITITRNLANVVRQIWDGPKTASGEPLWAALNKGAPLNALGNTIPSDGGQVGDPFFVPQTWVRYFLKRDTAYDLANLTSPGLRDLFAESVSKFASIIDSADPDLSAFKHAGGKLLAWHGQSDQLIFPQGSVKYREAVEKRLGGRHAGVDDFFRLFLAPGVDHCGAGSTVGASPVDAFAALRAWVEKGKAPDELAASSAQGGFTRKLCKWPLVAKYDGHGDPNLAASYRCVRDGCSK
ncbi:putative feruloyl esterase [Thozetella sp. PMI_491]|nr:putative feruloyl esterase [Thozetella sp. PMI_491]